MLEIEMLPGGHGDAMVVGWKNGSGKERRLLIDAGTVHSYDDVKARLLARKDDRYEAFVVTHVDEDHIGGAVALLEDQQLRHKVDDVWFNGFVHCAEGGSVLGPVHGERLTRLIQEGSHHWNRPFTWPAIEKVPDAMARSVGGPAVVAGTGQLPRIELDGAVIHLLSPTGPKLKRMAAVWDEVVRKAKIVPGDGTDELPTTPSPHHKAVQDVGDLTPAQLLALATTGSDSSEANGSSIAFILEVPGQDPARPVRVLFGADAHSSVLKAALVRFGKQVGEARVRLDAFKLSHHGSKANISAKLMAVIDCDTFLVSTNGDTFGHPDDAAIACAITGAGRPTTFHCNYDSDRTRPWVQRGKPHDATFVLPKGGKKGLVVSVGA